MSSKRNLAPWMGTLTFQPPVREIKRKDNNSQTTEQVSQVDTNQNEMMVSLKTNDSSKDSISEIANGKRRTNSRKKKHKSSISSSTSNDYSSKIPTWRKRGYTLRQRVLQADEGNHGSGSAYYGVSNDIPIQQYYNVASKVFNQFLHHPIDTMNEMIESYLIGKRLAYFLSIVLPKHKDYNNNTIEEQTKDRTDNTKYYAFVPARDKSKEQLITVLKYIDQIEQLIDKQEHEDYIRSVIVLAGSSSYDEVDEVINNQTDATTSSTRFPFDNKDSKTITSTTEESETPLLKNMEDDTIQGSDFTIKDNDEDDDDDDDDGENNTTISTIPSHLFLMMTSTVMTTTVVPQENNDSDTDSETELRIQIIPETTTTNKSKTTITESNSYYDTNKMSLDESYITDSIDICLDDDSTACSSNTGGRFLCLMEDPSSTAKNTILRMVDSYGAEDDENNNSSESSSQHQIDEVDDIDDNIDANTENACSGGSEVEELTPFTATTSNVDNQVYLSFQTKSTTADSQRSIDPIDSYDNNTTISTTAFTSLGTAAGSVMSSSVDESKISLQQHHNRGILQDESLYSDIIPLMNKNDDVTPLMNKDNNAEVTTKRSVRKMTKLELKQQEAKVRQFILRDNDQQKQQQHKEMIMRSKIPEITKQHSSTNNLDTPMTPKEHDDNMRWAVQEHDELKRMAEELTSRMIEEEKQDQQQLEQQEEKLQKIIKKYESPNRGSCDPPGEKDTSIIVEEESISVYRKEFRNRKNKNNNNNLNVSTTSTDDSFSMDQPIIMTTLPRSDESVQSSSAMTSTMVQTKNTEQRRDVTPEFQDRYKTKDIKNNKSYDMTSNIPAVTPEQTAEEIITVRYQHYDDFHLTAMNMPPTPPHDNYYMSSPSYDDNGSHHIQALRKNLNDDVHHSSPSFRILQERHQVSSNEWDNAATTSATTALLSNSDTTGPLSKKVDLNESLESHQPSTFIATGFGSPHSSCDSSRNKQRRDNSFISDQDSSKNNNIRNSNNRSYEEEWDAEEENVDVTTRGNDASMYEKLNCSREYDENKFSDEMFHHHESSNELVALSESKIINPFDLFLDQTLSKEHETGSIPFPINLEHNAQEAQPELENNGVVSSAASVNLKNSSPYTNDAKRSRRRIDKSSPNCHVGDEQSLDNASSNTFAADSMDSVGFPMHRDYSSTICHVNKIVHKEPQTIEFPMIPESDPNTSNTNVDDAINESFERKMGARQRSVRDSGLPPRSTYSPSRGASILPEKSAIGEHRIGDMNSLPNINDKIKCSNISEITNSASNTPSKGSSDFPYAPSALDWSIDESLNEKIVEDQENKQTANIPDERHDDSDEDDCRKQQSEVNHYFTSLYQTTERNAMLAATQSDGIVLVDSSDYEVSYMSHMLENSKCDEGLDQMNNQSSKKSDYNNCSSDNFNESVFKEILQTENLGTMPSDDMCIDYLKMSAVPDASILTTHDKTDWNLLIDDENKLKNRSIGVRGMNSYTDLSNRDSPVPDHSAKSSFADPEDDPPSPVSSSSCSSRKKNDDSHSESKTIGYILPPSPRDNATSRCSTGSRLSELAAEIGFIGSPENHVQSTSLAPESSLQNCNDGYVLKKSKTFASPASLHSILHAPMLTRSESLTNIKYNATSASAESEGDALPNSQSPILREKTDPFMFPAGSKKSHSMVLAELSSPTEEIKFKDTDETLPCPSQLNYEQESITSRTKKSPSKIFLSFGKYCKPSPSPKKKKGKYKRMYDENHGDNVLLLQGNSSNDHADNIVSIRRKDANPSQNDDASDDDSSLVLVKNNQSRGFLLKCVRKIYSS